MKGLKEITVRRAVRADMPGIVRLWRELMDHHRPFDPYLQPRVGGQRIFAGWVRKGLKSRKQLVLVAESDGRLLGYTLAHIRTLASPIRQIPYGSIMDMCVTKSARRKGVGKRLFLGVQEWIRAKGLSRLEVGYLPANRHAISFWHKMGFRPLRHTGLKWLKGRKR